MEIKLVDPTTDKRWDKYVLQHPEGTIFHHSSWAKVLQERYCTQPNYYAMENDQGQITAIAPFFLISTPMGSKRMVCLPCSEYCFPLADSLNDLVNLIAKSKEDAQRFNISYMEIRGLKGTVKPDRLLLKPHPYYLNHVTPLEKDSERLRNKLSRQTRYHINRAEKAKVIIRESRNEDDLKKLHQLTCNTRRRINLLPWPYRFFRSIYLHMILPGHGFLLLAEVEGNIASGGIFLTFGDKVINKINASDPKYIQLRTNYLLIWKAMERSCEQSFRFFDLGITNPENNGLINYKRHWESLETVLPYYYYPDIRGTSALPETSLLYKAHTTINRLLPDFALRLAAEMLYKRMG